MQVGNTYIDIKIRGYDKENIVTLSNIKMLQIVETAGTSLPYMYGTLFTYNKNVADYFQQNNFLDVTLGTSPEKADTFSIQLIDAAKDQDKSSTGWTIEFAGFIGPNSYMMDKISKSYTGNSLMIAQQIIKENIGTELETNLEEVKENQVVWLQTYQTTCFFLVNTLLHMDIRPSFPLFSFDKHGKFTIRDFEKVLQEEPKYYFTPITPQEKNQIQYLNNFNVESFKPEYNLFSGYNKVTEIFGAVEGVSNHNIVDNKPILASTMKSEKLLSGNRVSLNKIQSENVHKTYFKAFAHNTDKLLSLSSMIGCLKLAGRYYEDIKPLDLVFVDTGREGGSDGTIDGKYLVDTVVTTISFATNNITTLVYVTRDNKNNVENYVTSDPERIKIKKSLMEKLVDEVSNIRVTTALCRSIISGDYLDSLLSFFIESKNNLLRMFSMCDVRLDFTGQIEYLMNALFVSNSLMNTLFMMIFPYSVADTLRDFLIRKPTTRQAVGIYIADYVPMQVQGLISDLIDSITSTHETLSDIAEDNGLTWKGESKVASEPIIPERETEDRITRILQSFENNTTGLDIPFPIVALTDSQQLLPEDELRKYIADQTILSLTEAGYMEGVDANNFEDILLGKKSIEFSTIQKINKNAGDKFNYRFWGTYGPEREALYAWIYEDETKKVKEVVYTKVEVITKYIRLFNDDFTPYEGSSFKVYETSPGSEKYSIFYVEGEEKKEAKRDVDLDVNSNALAQLTDFYIKKSFKDRYRTLPCTKLISATKNARLYFACPVTEKNIKFYINSKRVILKSFPIDLGYKDPYGNPVKYNVYYTETGYNSNSTMLEVRQGA